MEQISENKRRVRLLGLKKFQEIDRARKARQAAKQKEMVNLKRIYWMQKTRRNYAIINQ